MSDATETTTDSSEEGSVEPKRKKGRRRDIFIMVPIDIDDLNADDIVASDDTDEEDDDEQSSGGIRLTDQKDQKKKKPKVKAVTFKPMYQMYAVPGGHGQKAAIRKILKKHNVDLRNIHRIRMFAGEKKFEIETQYNIRF